MEIEILIDNSLHGKLYICKKDNTFFKAIITSANFTTNGLSNNNEWGVCIEDSDTIERIVSDLRRNIVFDPITEEILKEFETKVNAAPKPQEVTYVLDLTSSLKLKPNRLNIPDNVNYWLKPIGVSRNPISKDYIIDENNCNVHFSRRRPSGVRIGDILIVYAVGDNKIVSITRVNSDIKNTGIEGDRWPYYVDDGLGG